MSRLRETTRSRRRSSSSSRTALEPRWSAVSVCWKGNAKRFASPVSTSHLLFLTPIRPRNHTTVAVRSFRLARKGRKLEFKALDSTLRRTDKLGNKEALTYKSSAMDAMVPTLLGVSKAILESVVFCHQEEANWPLAEG